MCSTNGSDGALITPGDASGADQGAELHQGLIVGPGRAAGARKNRARDRPDPLLSRPALDVDIGREHALQHPRDVGIDQLGPALVGERTDCARRVGADAGQRTQRGHVRRQGRGLVAPAVRHMPGERVEVPRPRVVAEPRPRFGHASRSGACDVVQGGEGGEELSVLRHDARDLRLLKHQLGDEDAIRIARLPPGEVAPVGAKPAAEASTEAARLRDVDRRLDLRSCTTRRWLRARRHVSAASTSAPW